MKSNINDPLRIHMQARAEEKQHKLFYIREAKQLK